MIEQLSQFIGDSPAEILLTFVLTVAVVWQAALTARLAKVADRQADISEAQAKLTTDSAERQRQLESPRIRFEASHHSLSPGTNVDGTHASGNLYGFKATNESLLDVNIVTMEFDVAVEAEGGKGITVPVIPIAVLYDYLEMSDTDLPRRLRRGESLRIHYAVEYLKDLRVRPMCRDSLGNTHYAEHWAEYSGNSMRAFVDPGTGRVSADEYFHNLGPGEKRLRPKQC